ncbi:MAG TPA: sigma-70 family RNA polymerase sigma factor [Polyangiaceae bacterium]|nr:sigma-70 family RNA polymerase sigma factor [Polyangiaceae bacterium]
MTPSSPSLSSPDITDRLEEAAAPALSFRQVYDTHFAFVWRAVANRGVAPAALDDVVQEVFLVVHRKLADFQGRSSVRTWLSGISRRVVSDHVKKRGNRPVAHEALEDHPLESGENPGRALERRAAAELVDALLAKLPDAQREVFLLYELEQLTTREIAELTGANENTVQTRLKAARLAFQQALARHRAASARREA